MRIGSNPAKAHPHLEGYGRHRVIIPIYIPHLEGYFEQALDVLKLCLESLRRTAADRANITLVSNGCTSEVVEELEQCRQAGWVDQLVINHTNRGKVDAVVSVARGCFEPFITISDCDILFKPGWVEETFRMFHAFPEAGFVCPFPSPSLTWYHTSATVIAAICHGEWKTIKVVADEDLDCFAESIGSSTHNHPRYKAKQAVVERGGVAAVVGGGHCVFTMRREVLSATPLNPSLDAIAGSEEQWLDAPPDKIGAFRLSLPRNYVHHIGNKIEGWIHKELAEYQPTPSDTYQATALRYRQSSVAMVPWRLRHLLARVIRKLRKSEGR